MFIEFMLGYQSGEPTTTTWMAIPRVLVLLSLVLVGALVVLHHGKSSNLKTTLSSSPAGAWLMSQFEKDPVNTLNKTSVEKLAKDHRLNMDSVAARRLSRAKFLELHSEFNHNVPAQEDREMKLNVTEKYVKNSRNLEIFVKSWVPAERRPKGLIFICHGYGDTITFFNEGLARAFAVAGYAVHGMDYPGFGLSEGLHGYIPNFDVLVNDVVEHYRSIKERPENKGLSCFLFGESMGGAVAIKAHLKDPSLWDGAVLVAPMCKIADTMYPPWLLVQIMIALAHVIPKAKLVPHTDIAEIGFRDIAKRRRAAYNPVAYIGNPRLGTALQLLQTTDFVESKLSEVSLPLLVLHGAADQVTDPSISKLLHERAKSKDKTIKLYDDAWHCLLQGEPDDVVENVMMDIVTWLDAHAASKGDFDQQNEIELEDRIAMAAPHLIEFGKLNAVKEIL